MNEQPKQSTDYDALGIPEGKRSDAKPGSSWDEISAGDDAAGQLVEMAVEDGKIVWTDWFDVDPDSCPSTHLVSFGPNVCRLLVSDYLRNDMGEEWMRELCSSPYAVVSSGPCFNWLGGCKYGCELWLAGPDLRSLMLPGHCHGDAPEDLLGPDHALQVYVSGPTLVATIPSHFRRRNTLPCAMPWQDEHGNLMPAGHMICVGGKCIPGVDAYYRMLPCGDVEVIAYGVTDSPRDKLGLAGGRYIDYNEFLQKGRVLRRVCKIPEAQELLGERFLEGRPHGGQTETTAMHHWVCEHNGTNE